MQGMRSESKEKNQRRQSRGTGRRPHTPLSLTRTSHSARGREDGHEARRHNEKRDATLPVPSYPVAVLHSCSSPSSSVSLSRSLRSSGNIPPSPMGRAVPLFGERDEAQPVAGAGEQESWCFPTHTHTLNGDVISDSLNTRDTLDILLSTQCGK